MQANPTCVVASSAEQWNASYPPLVNQWCSGNLQRSWQLARKLKLRCLKLRQQAAWQIWQRFLPKLVFVQKVPMPGVQMPAESSWNFLRRLPKQVIASSLKGLLVLQRLCHVAGAPLGAFLAPSSSFCRTPRWDRTCGDLAIMVTEENLQRY